MNWMNRREFLTASAMTAGALVAGSAPLHAASTAGAPGDFDFVFLTDTHIQPELAAAEGCAMAFKKVRSLPADFVLQGGDHIFDGLAVDRQRVDLVTQLYARTEQAVEKPVHHAIGNHDLFGVLPKSGLTPESAGYGKKFFVELHGPTYYSFDHKGYHFIVLDTVQPTADRSWEARIDDEQLSWLANDLGKVGPGAPIVVAGHVPLVSAASEYAAPTAQGGSGVAAAPVVARPQTTVGNAWQVLPLLEKHNVLAVFQGHTHINEVVRFRGVQYVTGGAVCGNWWHGTRWGIPEGFTVVSLRGGKIDWRYETYGFHSIDPQNT
jgi:3',5'-cyclic AMP phosphodiesterase CpdA